MITESSRWIENRKTIDICTLWNHVPLLAVVVSKSLVRSKKWRESQAMLSLNTWAIPTWSKDLSMIWGFMHWCQDSTHWRFTFSKKALSDLPRRNIRIVKNRPIWDTSIWLTTQLTRKMRTMLETMEPTEATQVKKRTPKMPANGTWHSLSNTLKKLESTLKLWCIESKTLWLKRCNL